MVPLARGIPFIPEFTGSEILMRISMPLPGLLHRLGFFALVGIMLFGCSAYVQAQCSGTPANAIIAENCLTGNPSSEWDISTSDAGSLAIQGFSTDISVTPGNTIYFKIDTPST